MEWLDTTEIYSLTLLWGQQSEIKSDSVILPLKALERNHSLSLPASVGLCGGITPIPASVFIRFFPWISVCLQISPYKDTSHSTGRALPKPVGPCLNSITTAEILFPNKVTYTGTGEHIFLGDICNPQNSPKWPTDSVQFTSESQLTSLKKLTSWF